MTVTCEVCHQDHFVTWRGLQDFYHFLWHKILCSDTKRWCPFVHTHLPSNTNHTFLDTCSHLTLYISAVRNILSSYNACTLSNLVWSSPNFYTFDPIQSIWSSLKIIHHPQQSSVTTDNTNIIKLLTYYIFVSWMYIIVTIDLVHTLLDHKGEVELITAMKSKELYKVKSCTCQQWLYS